MNNPIISIVIVNFNTFQMTSTCIHSIIKNTSDVDYEVLLVDNASSECDPLIFKKAFPRINLVVSDRNLGFAGGNNLGIQQAKGKYILLLNSDTELLNDAVSEAYRIMERDATIGVLSGQLLYPDGRLQAVAGRFPSIKTEVRELFRVNQRMSSTERARYYLGTEWDYTQPVDADWVWGAFFMFRKSDLDLFPGGRLHDTFFMYGEDVQWCYHFKHVLNKRVVYHPSPKAIHYIGGSDQSGMDSDAKYIEKMLPHEQQWLCMVKGQVYTFFHYLIKGVFYYSLRNGAAFRRANVYMKLAFNGRV